ncbi:nucleotide-binding protein [Thermococcus profundus]|uniref:Nucleotide-binding protein n=1 Tax=Thermococcus profundus TaxID=49899 RepID=A0A2Z2MLK4_THEPR|nr:type II toxin-antitoxin system VapC family toxin [Thermococcus profundus]ASJ03301.1 nucleotide-binding protein [Thermococcus profundus]
MRAVIDTSVVFHLFSSFYPERTQITERIIEMIQSGQIEGFAPRIGRAEFVAVLSRYFEKNEVIGALSGYDEVITWVPEELIMQDVIELAFELKHHVSDLYFVATAKLLNAALLTNDRKMADIAKSVGLKSFYLIEEADEFFKLVGVDG